MAKNFGGYFFAAHCTLGLTYHQRSASKKLDAQERSINANKNRPINDDCQFLQSDARSGKSGFATLSRPSVRLSVSPSVRASVTLM